MITAEEGGELQNKIEAILFSAGRAVTLEEMSRTCAVSPAHVKEAVSRLKEDMEQRHSPLLLVEELNAWRLTVREKYLDLVRNITPHTELDKATLETLAVIAWKQPVMQADVIKIRTSAAYEHITRLVEMGFIAKEKKGRSYVLKTTGRFFDYFDLPGKEALKDMLKGIEGGLQETAKEEGLGGEKLGTLEVYTTKGEKGEIEEKTYQAYQAMPEKAEEALERVGALDVYEGEEPREGMEAPQEVTDEEGEETAQPEEEKEEEPAEENEEEKARRVIGELAEEEEPEAGEKKESVEEEGSEEAPEKRLHPALEAFISEEEEKGKKEKKARKKMKHNPDDE